jgi:hypothetical protein
MESQILNRGETMVSWPRFNIRDLLFAMMCFGIGLTWPILLIFILPAVVIAAMTRMGIHWSVSLYCLASACPALFMIMLHLAWAFAWVVLGHQPSSGNDDPEQISTMVTAMFYTTAVLLLSLPIAFLFGLMCFSVSTLERLYSNTERNSNPNPDQSGVLSRSLLSLHDLAFFVVWLIFVFFWITDPGQALFWFFD